MNKRVIHHNTTSHDNAYGSVAVYFGYGVGDAEAFVYCHDWLYGGGNFGQLVYHSFDILVYL